MSHAAPDQPAAGGTQSPGVQPSPLVVRAAGLTDPGRVRPSNEDHFLIAVLARSLWVEQTSLPHRGEYRGRNRSHVLLVADGVGGNAAGEVASALSVGPSRSLSSTCCGASPTCSPTTRPGSSATSARRSSRPTPASWRRLCITPSSPAWGRP
jgi:hypothetical protein